MAPNLLEVDTESLTGVLPERVDILCAGLGLFIGVCIFGFIGEMLKRTGPESDCCASTEANSTGSSVILQGKLSVLLIFPDLVMD